MTKDTVEEVQKLARRYYHGLSDKQWEECKDSFPYGSIPHIVLYYHQSQLKKIAKEVEALYYITTEEDSTTKRIDMDEVLEIINTHIE